MKYLFFAQRSIQFDKEQRHSTMDLFDFITATCVPLSHSHSFDGRAVKLFTIHTLCLSHSNLIFVLNSTELQSQSDDKEIKHTRTNNMLRRIIAVCAVWCCCCYFGWWLPFISFMLWFAAWWSKRRERESTNKHNTEKPKLLLNVYGMGYSRMDIGVTYFA